MIVLILLANNQKNMSEFGRANCFSHHAIVVLISFLCIGIFIAGFTYGMIVISKQPTWAPIGQPTFKPTFTPVPTFTPTCAPTCTPTCVQTDLHRILTHLSDVLINLYIAQHLRG